MVPGFDSTGPRITTLSHQTNSRNHIYTSGAWYFVCLMRIVNVRIWLVGVLGECTVKIALHVAPAFPPRLHDLGFSFIGRQE